MRVRVGSLGCIIVLQKNQRGTNSQGFCFFRSSHIPTSLPYLRHNERRPFLPRNPNSNSVIFTPFKSFWVFFFFFLLLVAPTKRMTTTAKSFIALWKKALRQLIRWERVHFPFFWHSCYLRVPANCRIRNPNFIPFLILGFSFIRCGRILIFPFCFSRRSFRHFISGSLCYFSMEMVNLCFSL